MSEGVDQNKSETRTIEISDEEFSTKAGKLFAINLSDLYDFINKGFVMTAMFGNSKSFITAIIGSDLPTLLPEFGDLSKLKRSDVLKLKEDLLIAKGKEITDDALSGVNDQEILDFMSVGIDSIQSGSVEIQDTFSPFDINPRLNAYYFFALEAYLQVYTKSLYRFVIEKSPVNQRVGFAKQYSDQSNAAPMIKNLLRANDKFVSKLLKQKGSVVVSENLIPIMDKINAIRKIIAHGQPKLGKSSIESYFQDLAKLSTIQLQQDQSIPFEKGSSSKIPEETIEKLETAWVQMISDLNSSYLVRNITKELIISLTEFDEIIHDEFLANNKVQAP